MREAKTNHRVILKNWEYKCSRHCINVIPLQDYMSIHFSVDGLLICFQFGAIVNKAAINILLHATLKTKALVSAENVPRSWGYGSRGSFPRWQDWQLLPGFQSVVLMCSPNRNVLKFKTMQLSFQLVNMPGCTSLYFLDHI